MWVELGNDKAQEGYRDPDSDEPDLVRYRPLDGERITTIVFPEDITLQEAFTTAAAAGQVHFQADESEDNPLGHHRPTWVESDSAGLKALLSEHFGLTKATQQRRPKTWGKEFGLHEDESLHSAQMYASRGTAATDEEN